MLHGADRIAVLIAVFITAALALGCGVHVRAPGLRPGEPATSVYIVDYGRHSGLLLPRDDDTMAEYGFGQWHWYALDQSDWWRAPRILLLPSRATLGTRDVPTPDDAADLVRRFGFRSAFEVRVRPERAEALLRALDARMSEHAEEAVQSESFGLTFVPVADWYWLPYNCNTAVARWLRMLDCRVSGLAFFSNYTVRPDRGSAWSPAIGPVDGGAPWRPDAAEYEDVSRGFLPSLP